jgi:tetratricopeptide (TPR) repeat protein
VYRRGDPRRALELAEEARELSEAGKDEAALAQAHNILGVLARHRGDLGTAEDHLNESLALAEMLTDPGAQAAALNNLSLVLADKGDLDRAESLAQQALRRCITLGDRHREAAINNNLADLYHLAGRPEESMSHLKRAVAIFAEVGVPKTETRPEIWKLQDW